MSQRSHNTAVRAQPFVFQPPAPIAPFATTLHTATAASRSQQPNAAATRHTAAAASYHSVSNRMILQPGLMVDDDDEPDEVDQAILADLISPGLARSSTPGAPPSTLHQQSVSNLVSVLAKRVMEVNQKTIARRAEQATRPQQQQTRRKQEPRSEEEKEQESSATSGSGSGSNSEEENRSNHTGTRRSSKQHKRRKHASKRGSSTASQSQQQPRFITPRPLSPPTSSLQPAATVEAKVDTRPSSYFFPNPHTAHLGTPSARAVPSAAVMAELAQQLQHQQPHATHQPAASSHSHSSAQVHPLLPTYAAYSPAVAPPVPEHMPLPVGPPQPAMRVSRPPGQSLSPGTLATRAARELQVLETLQASQAQLASVTHAHALNVIQAETEKLGQMLQEKERKEAEEHVKAEQQRRDFIARTHAIDAEREAVKQRALAEREQLQQALHAQQLHAQTQQALMLQELDRAKTRAAEEAVRAAHALELERVRSSAAAEAELAASRRVKEEQSDQTRQAAQREEQHSAALALALTQSKANADNFAQLHSLARGLQVSQSQQLAQVLTHLNEQSSKGIERVTEQQQRREERVLQQLQHNQQAAVQAILEATAGKALGKGPIQIQLVGANARDLVSAVAATPAQPAPGSFHLQLPNPASPGGGRRPSNGAAAAAAASVPTHRSRTESLGYSQDFDAAAAADEDYEEDFVTIKSPKVSARSNAATAAAAAGQPFQTPLKAQSGSPVLRPAQQQQSARRASTASVEDSIQFDEDMPAAASDTTFHLDSSPIPRRGGQQPAQSDEIEEDAGAAAASMSSLRGGARGGYGASGGVEEEDGLIVEEDEGGDSAGPAIKQAGNNLSASHDQEYSTDDFANDSAAPTPNNRGAVAAASMDEYGNASFAPDVDAEQQQHYAGSSAVAAPVAAPDSPTPLLQSIDALLAQQQSLLDARYTSLADSTRLQLSVLHAAKLSKGWSEREVNKRKLVIKTAFQAEKGAITAQRAELATRAQQQKLAICRQAQQLTQARIDAQAWEARLERAEMGGSMESVPSSPQPNRQQQLAAARSRSSRSSSAQPVRASSSSSKAAAASAAPRRTSSTDELEVSFSDAADVPVAGAKRVHPRGSPAVAVSKQRASGRSAAYASGLSSDGGFDLEASLSQGEYELSTDGVSGADGPSNPDRERYLALQSELQSLRAARKVAEADPHARQLARQEQRLDATQELARRILAEKRESLLLSQREQRVADKKKEVGRILKEVQNLEREVKAAAAGTPAAAAGRPESPSNAGGIRSPRKPSPPSSALAHRSPRDKLLRSRHSFDAAQGPLSFDRSAAGSRAEIKDNEEIEIDVDESAPVRSTTPRISKASPRRAAASAAAAAAAAHDEEEVAISYGEDSDVQQQQHAAAVAHKAPTPASTTPRAPAAPHTPGSTVTPRAKQLSPGLRPGSGSVRSPATEEIEVDFEDDETPAPAAAAAAAPTHVPSTRRHTAPRTSADESAASIEEEDVIAAGTATEVDEVEDEAGAVSAHHSSSAIETEPDEAHSTSYAEDFVDPRTVGVAQPASTAAAAGQHSDHSVEEDVHTPPRKGDSTPEEEYAEEFLAASPSASVSSQRRIAPAGASAAGAAAAGSSHHDLSVAEDLLQASTASADYQADSFVASNSSIGAHKPASTAAAPINASVSIAEESIADAAAPTTPVKSVLSPARSSSGRNGGSRAGSDAGDAVEYSADSFNESMGADAPAAATASPAAVLSTSQQYGDASFVGDVSHHSSAEEIGEEIPSAHQSLSHDQLEALTRSPAFVPAAAPAPAAAPVSPEVVQQVFQAGSAEGSPDVTEDTTEPENRSSDALTIALQAAQPTQPDDIAEEISPTAAADQSTSSVDHAPTTPPAAARPFGSKPLSKQAQLAALEQQARQQQDAAAAVGTGTTASPSASASVSFDEEDSSAAAASSPAPTLTPREQRDELVNAITLSLLQDLTKDLADSASLIPAKQRERRTNKAKRAQAEAMAAAANAAANSSSAASSGGVSPVKVDVLTPPVNEHTLSPLSPALTPVAASQHVSPPLSSDLGVASPLGLNPQATSPSSRASGTVPDDNWSLESPASVSPTPMDPRTATIDAKLSGAPVPARQPTAAELNAAVENEIARLREEEEVQLHARVHLTKPYVTGLLHHVFNFEANDVGKSSPDPALIEASAGLSAEAAARLLPPLNLNSLLAVEAIMDADDDEAPKSANLEQVRATRATFHRLLLATSNQYISAYNASVVRHEQSLAPWSASVFPPIDPDDAAEDAAASHPSFVFSLSNQRVRRAPGGLIISLKGRKDAAGSGSDATSSSAPSEVHSRWVAHIISKVWRKVASMNAQTAAMSRALKDASDAAALAPSLGPGMDPSDLANLTPDPRLSLQIIVEHEAALVNSILAKQMKSIEPGPAGATQRDWKQSRAIAEAAAAAAAKPASTVAASSVAASSPSEDAFDSSFGSASDSSMLYSGSEFEWEGGFEAAESLAVVSELADHLLGLVLEDCVAALGVVEQKKYTRKLMARAKERERIRQSQHIATGAGSMGNTLMVAGESSPDQVSPLSSSPRDPTDRKKARRQAIKL